MSGSRERGAMVFERACAGCHGPNGTGGERNGATGGAINAPAFLALISDQALRRIIITGRPDLGMPTYAEQRRPPSRLPTTHLCGNRRPGGTARRLAGRLKMSLTLPSNDLAVGDYGDITMDSPTPCEVAIAPSPSGRRTFLRWCTAICGAIAATVLEHSGRRILFRPAKATRSIGSTWGLSPTFHSTRRVGSTLTTRCANPGTASPRSPACTCATRARMTNGRISSSCYRSTAPTSAAPLAGSSNRACSCALPRRRLLRRWRACVRSAAARFVSLRVARAERPAARSKLLTIRRCKTHSSQNA